MTLVQMKHLVIETSDKNGNPAFVIGTKLGDREPAIHARQGVYLIFDTEKEAQEYIDEEL